MMTGFKGVPAIAAILVLGACTTHDVAATPQADLDSAATPAYMIVMGTVSDMDAFIAGYASKLPPVYAKYGGHYLSIGGQHEVLEGETHFKSHVISEWPGGIADARAFWASPEYEELKAARINGGWGRFDVFIVDGLPSRIGEAEKSQ